MKQIKAKAERQPLMPAEYMTENPHYRLSSDGKTVGVSGSSLEDQIFHSFLLSISSFINLTPTVLGAFTRLEEHGGLIQ